MLLDGPASSSPPDPSMSASNTPGLRTGGATPLLPPHTSAALGPMHQPAAPWSTHTLHDAHRYPPSPLLAFVGVTAPQPPAPAPEQREVVLEVLRRDLVQSLGQAIAGRNRCPRTRGFPCRSRERRRLGVGAREGRRRGVQPERSIWITDLASPPPPAAAPQAGRPPAPAAG
jgi:hypothetical protein